MKRRLGVPFLSIVVLLAAPHASVAQTSLTELGAANAARNQMMANSAGTAPAGQATAAPAAAAPANRVVFGGVKYTLSYALVGALLGLGVYLVCRPSNRHAFD